MKFIIQLLFALRNGLLKIGEKLFEKMRDPETGKVKNMSPENVKRLGVTAFAVFIVGIALYQVFTSNFNFIDGVKDFESEVEQKLDITAQEIPYRKDISGDPLAKLRGEQGDSFGRSRDGDDDSINPDAGECLKLLEKLKSGQNLSQTEKKRLKWCLENNVLGLTPEELELARKLLEDGLLSDEDKKLYNELFGAEPECQKVFEGHMITDVGNEFLTKILQDETYNAPLVNLLKNQEALRRAIITPGGLKNALKISDEEVEILKSLLENCSPELLIKMLTDPKLKEVLSRLLEAATNDPDFMRKVMEAENLTPSEKDLLRRFMTGQIPIDSSDYEIAQALLSSDPLKRDMARNILAARELGRGDIAEALTKKLLGEELSPEEADLVTNLDGALLRDAAAAMRSGDDALAGALLKKATGEELTDEEQELLGVRSEFGDIPTGVDKEALARALADEIARRQAEMDALREALARAEAAAREAAERLAKGLPLTPEQQAALQRYADLQKQLAELQKRLQADRDRLAALLTGMQSTIDQIGIDIQTLYPSGMTVEEAEWTKCKDIKPLILVRKPKAKVKRKYRKRRKGLIGPDGKELTPEQTRIVRLMRKKQAEELAEKERLEKELLNPLGGDQDFLAGQTAALNSQLAQGGANQGGAQALIISENNNLKPFELAPDLVIPGLLLTRVLVTDKGSGQKVRVKVLADVYDLSGKIVIPRNSIAFGNTGGFDVDTGIMNINLDTVSVGGRPVDVALAMGSADLTPGLKGEVRDTRGKLLLGTFISSFTAGAVGAISQNFIAPFQDSELLADSLTGAGLQGAAEIAQRIAELYAGDLQNAARVYYAPANIRVILTPTQ